MRRRKNNIVFIFSLLLLFSICNCSFTSAGFDIGDLKIDAKGRFTYRFESYSEGVSRIIMTMTLTIENKTTSIRINNEDVVVYEGEMSGGIESFEYLDSSLDYIEYVEDSGKMTGVFYYPKDADLSKSEFTMEFQLKENIYNSVYESKLDYLSIEEKLFNDEPETIEIGSNWTETVKKEKTETTCTNVIGTECEPVTEDEDITITTKYECIGQETVTVTAGSFETFVIKETLVGESNYSLEYKDKETGLTVKTIGYNATGIPTQNEMELISCDFSYSEPIVNDNSKDNGIPGFEILLITLSFITIIILKRKKHRRDS